MKPFSEGRAGVVNLMKNEFINLFETKDAV